MTRTRVNEPLQLNDKEKRPLNNNSLKYSAATFFTTSLAVYAMMRKGNYRAALRFYPKCGGGGLNLYKEKANGDLHRLFAVDYHPFWDKTKKQPEWKLHYHRGDNPSQMKKHRPYEGGW